MVLGGVEVAEPPGEEAEDVDADADGLLEEEAVVITVPPEKLEAQALVACSPPLLTVGRAGHVFVPCAASKCI